MKNMIQGILIDILFDKDIIAEYLQSYYTGNSIGIIHGSITYAIWHNLEHNFRVGVPTTLTPALQQCRQKGFGTSKIITSPF